MVLKSAWWIAVTFLHIIIVCSSADWAQCLAWWCSCYRIREWTMYVELPFILVQYKKKYQQILAKQFSASGGYTCPTSNYMNALRGAGVWSSWTKIEQSRRATPSFGARRLESVGLDPFSCAKYQWILLQGELGSSMQNDISEVHRGGVVHVHHVSFRLRSRVCTVRTYVHVQYYHYGVLSPGDGRWGLM